MKYSESLFWGLVLLGAGVFALAQRFGYLTPFMPQAGIAALAVVSLFALVIYFAKGRRHWGWLFPVGIFGGLALAGAMAVSGNNKPTAGTPLFVGLLIPFAAAYAIDRVRNWWALIPGGIILFLALTTLVVTFAEGEWVGALFLFMVAVSFLAVYLSDRSRKWALLVGYIAAILGIAPLMSTPGTNARYYGAVFLCAIALPFYVFNFRYAGHWWAIIPAGSLTTIALIAALAISGLFNSSGSAYAYPILLCGIGLTFAIIWIRNSKLWARTVAICLFALALVSFLAASYMQIVMPLAVILLGCYLVLTALRPKAIPK